MKKTTATTPKKLTMNGEFNKRQTSRKIQVDGETIWIGGRCYDYLLTLVKAIQAGDHWVSKNDLPGVERENKAALIYRLKKESGLQIMNDNRGSYRLAAENVEILENADSQA